MALLEKFNPSKIDRLKEDLDKILDHMSDSLNKLEVSTVKLNNNIKDRVSTEASTIVREYRMLIKKTNVTITETMEKVKVTSDKIKSIENMSDDLR